MSDFSITDNLGNPLEGVKVDWTSASALFNYLKTETLHLAVAPDFLSRKDDPLSKAAAKPLEFQMSVGHDFEIGSATPEINVTPGAQVALCVNASAGSNLFDDDPFPVVATVPAQTGYVGLSITGSVDANVSGTGDLTFGVDRSQSITLDYLKAFALGANEPTLGSATGQMISSYAIVAGVDDFAKLQVNDIATVSGTGSLQISGTINVATPVNPLASVNLPMGAGTVAVEDGVMAGLEVSLAIYGSYQIRVRKLPGGVMELSYLQKQGTKLQTDLTASAGLRVEWGTTDLLAKLLGGIAKDHIDPSILSGLTADEVKTFQSAIKAGVEHSVQVSLDLALSSVAENQPAFQYEVHPELLDAAGRAAVEKALKGDMSILPADAPGIKEIASAFSRMRSHGVSLKLNLLGIVNLISISNLISKCEFLTEPASGDLVIKETAASERISAITDPFDQQEALRKAMFESVLVTTTYLASTAVSIPVLHLSSMHFAANANTNSQTMSDYLTWFAALSLLSPAEIQGISGQFGNGGGSSCVVRAELDESGCVSLFFDAKGALRPASDYLEIGRQALRALLDPGSPIDQLRARMLADPLWQQALNIGPSPQLATILPIASTDPLYNNAMAVVTGDVYQITWWADAMRKAGVGLAQMRAFLSGGDMDQEEFSKRRDQLQKVMLGVVSAAQVHFHEPWGVVSLFLAAGSRQSAGYLKAGSLVIERQRPLAAFASN
jgi:hypothetical protein